MLLPLTGAAATASLSIESFSISGGETKEMVIDLNNPATDITLVQFDLRLPTGLTLKQTDGEYDIDIAGRTTWRKHSLDANVQADGTIRVLLASSSNAVLSGSSGAIISITLVASSSFNHGDIKLENILMVSPDEKETTQATYTYTISANTHTWDFTQWSEETVANLKADAAASKTEGWSDVEKKTDAEAGADPTELSRDNCFWYIGGEAEPTANGTAISELKGLVFNTTYGAARSMAIAVNYKEPNVASSFGPYNGPAYLWLGGKGKECFTIKNVKVGSDLTIKLESHKINDARGIQLFVGDQQIGTDFTPTTAEEKTFAISADQFPDSKTVDVVVKNTNGCHIYYIDAEIGDEPEPVVGSSDNVTATLEPITIQKGGEATLLINVENPDNEITLVQFDLRLPTGLSLKQTGGEYDIDIAGRTTWRKHSLDANAQADGSIRFLLASSSNTTIEGKSGAVIKMTLVASNTFNGGDIKLEGILMVTPDEKEIRQESYTYTVSPEPPPTSTAKLAIEPFAIQKNGEATMLIDLVNPDNEITLVQFDLRLPAGLTLKQTGGEYDIDIAGRTTWKKHSLDANATDGIIRFLLSSTKNAVFEGTGGAVIKMILQAGSSYKAGTEIRLENILLVTPVEKEIKPIDIVMIPSMNPDRIEGVLDNGGVVAPVYTFSGQKLKAPRKGLNIVGGKKILVK